MYLREREKVTQDPIFFYLNKPWIVLLLIDLNESKSSEVSIVF